ncbi:hypothetical protein [Brucella intermedia]|nr:hypothetical protein [Brucella intermedia]
MAKAETGNKVSSIAAKALSTGKATPSQIKAMAGSVLRQDETKGKRK